MDNYFESILYEAILRTEGYYIDTNRNGFNKLYPFTTENIKGYIDKFELTNKNLLTVGSSADQLINATLFGCKDITLIDICPFTKFYFYLKMSAILNLDYPEFLKFFCYKDYPKFCKDNKEAFDNSIFNSLKTTLRVLDYESYLFWDELFSNYQGLEIRKELFSHDEYLLKILQKANPFLKNEESFLLTKEKIKHITPQFIIDNIFETSIIKNYDNIWLSNIAAYYSLEQLKKLINNLLPHLNNNGMLIIAYLYETTKSTKYEQNWAEIYNIDKVLTEFSEYDIKLISFKGIRDIIFNSNKMNDSILLYKKKIK